MMGLAITPSIATLIAAGSPVAIGVSGGKDSQASALAVCEHLDRAGHTGPRLLVHSDLGMVEWRDSLPACRALAGHLDIELVVLRRAKGDLMERWESRWASSMARYENLSTVTLVPCWSTPSMRFCTDYGDTSTVNSVLQRMESGASAAPYGRINLRGVNNSVAERWLYAVASAFLLAAAR